MYRWNSSGGWNKTHGTVEKTPRVDSFEAGEIEGWGSLFVYTGASVRLALNCYPDVLEDRETLEVWHNRARRVIELSRKQNGFGGSQAFFLCPGCGGRVRYLYQAGASFLCRKCAKLSYKSQQEARSDSMFYFDKGMALAEKHLGAWPRLRPDGFSFCAWIPERPRYMHQSTYRRYLRRFAKYQDQHQRRQLRDMARLLHLFK